MTDAYAELHAHSNFSLLDGASHPEDLVRRAAELGMPALALTDHNAVYGAPRFLRAAREHGIHPVLGAELSLQSGHHLTVLVEDEAGWHNLCYLISRAQANAAKGQAALPDDELIGCTNGLIALSGCRQGQLPAALLAGKWRRAHDALRRLTTLFGPQNLYVELQNHWQPHDALLVERLSDLAEHYKLPCVVTNNVHYAGPGGHRLQDILVCIRHNLTLEETTALRRANAEYYLKSPAQMARLFPHHPQALQNTIRLAERCGFRLQYGLQDLPRFETPGGMSSSAYLRRLCQEALPQRYGEPPAAIREQLQRELEIIEQAGLANYFLIVADIVDYARCCGIRCQGRGSAANSLVAYLLHISPIDPLAHDLVFERFLSAERLQAGAFMPDIDVDFDAQRREEVIQYIYNAYGPAHTAMACTFSTFRRRSAFRDIGKALGLDPHAIAAIQRDLEDGKEPETQSTAAYLVELAAQIKGFPRHLGIHGGGMIITAAPLMGRVPTEPAAMPRRVVVQWDKDGLEDAGLVKIDVLGLRMLSAISDALQLIAQQQGQPPDLAALTYDDPAVYQMIAAADTLGVFQVESRAQTQLQPVLQAACFADLVVSISLIRPGPIQGDMVHPYLRRRRGIEPVAYSHPLLEPALRETLGVILFQEQVLKVARDLAGFTGGQGELLRRALSAKDAVEAIDRLRHDFVAGAQANGVPPETAHTVFDQLRAFGGYSFAKSHAAAFAVLVYQSAWLKRHHFLPFFTALLNNQPMGFWSPAVLVNEIKRKGFTVHPVDIHHSQPQCALENSGPTGIRLGFNYVKGLGENHVERILAAREQQPFSSLAGFVRRTRLPARLVENLVIAGAMDAWGIARRQLLWELGALPAQEAALDLEFQTPDAGLPQLTAAEAMLEEQAILGLSAGEHILSHLRPQLIAQRIPSSAQLDSYPNGATVRVAGLLVVHQAPPTAKGFHFLTLEDEHGLIDIIVNPAAYQRHRRILHTARLLLVQGRLQRTTATHHNVLAQNISAL